MGNIAVRQLAYSGECRLGSFCIRNLNWAKIISFPLQRLNKPGPQHAKFLHGTVPNYNLHVGGAHYRQGGTKLNSYVRPSVRSKLTRMERMELKRMECRWKNSNEIAIVIKSARMKAEYLLVHVQISQITNSAIQILLSNNTPGLSNFVLVGENNYVNTSKCFN